MFKIKFLTIIILTATTIMACGESFRGHFNGELTGFENNNLNQSIWTNNPTLNGDSDPDKNVLFDYRDELEGNESKTVLLGQKIKAFDIVLSKASSGEINLSARITFGCNSLIDYTTKVNSSDLSSMEVIDFGTKENYNLRVECTVRDCNQMVAVIHQRTIGEKATVLVGLMVDGKVGEELIYTSRHVTYTPYFQTFYGYQHYSQRNNCQPGNTTNNDTSLTGILTRLLGNKAIDKLKDKAEDFLKDLL